MSVSKRGRRQRRRTRPRDNDRSSHAVYSRHTIPTKVRTERADLRTRVHAYRPCRSCGLSTRPNAHPVRSCGQHDRTRNLVSSFGRASVHLMQSSDRPDEHTISISRPISTDNRTGSLVVRTIARTLALTARPDRPDIQAEPSYDRPRIAYDHPSDRSISASDRTNRRASGRTVETEVDRTL